MTVEYRRLHDVCGDHQPLILQNFARFIDDTALFAHGTFTIRQQWQHVERQLATEEIILINRDTVQQLRALPGQRIDGLFAICGGRQQAGDGYTRQATVVNQRFQRGQQLAGQTVRYRDDITVTVVSQDIRVDVRHHQRHVRLHGEQTAQVDHQAT